MINTAMDTSTVPAPHNPLSSAQLRYELPIDAIAGGPGPAGTRPFGLRAVQAVQASIRPWHRYCPIAQVAVGATARPLVETMGKEWKTKSSTDGDEGPEENYGREEE